MLVDPTELLGMSIEEVRKLPIQRPQDGRPTVEPIEDRFYLKLPASGLSFSAEADGRVDTIFLHSDGHEGYRGFDGSVPDALSFADDREAVRRRLGEPSASGGGRIIPFLGKAPIWDRFDGAQYSLHVSYGDDGGPIELITVMLPEAIPR